MSMTPEKTESTDTQNVRIERIVGDLMAVNSFLVYGPSGVVECS